ncbi:zinc ribbon domain-containing protein [Ectobacillus sp. sgz5001026]|uniref:zinc ribbon domain-containing protein n=1 Tax=Ectobacillus sp. sgz5001026 TaxID=3242473 RepID=UPI0036D34ADA
MVNLQETLESGVTKLHGGIEQGKIKLQLAQEMVQLKREIQDLLQKKAEFLLELGQLAYLQLRSDELQKVDLVHTIDPIEKIDISIYQANKRLSELKQSQEDGITCNCGAPLTMSDKFCGNCGTPNPMLNRAKETNLVKCQNCGQDTPNDASYCPVCGTKRN